MKPNMTYIYRKYVVSHFQKVIRDETDVHVDTKLLCLSNVLRAIEGP